MLNRISHFGIATHIEELAVWTRVLSCCQPVRVLLTLKPGGLWHFFMALAGVAQNVDNELIGSQVNCLDDMKFCVGDAPTNSVPALDTEPAWSYHLSIYMESLGGEVRPGLELCPAKTQARRSWYKIEMSETQHVRGSTQYTTSSGVRGSRRQL